MAAPGWYPDTTMSGTQRYWDGERWTDHVAPLPGAAVVPSAPRAQPRRRADGSVAGPSLAVALIVIALGAVLSIASVVAVVPAFIDTLSGPRWDVPGTERVDLGTGTWVLYERVAFGGFGSVGPGDVTVDGPDPVRPRFDSTSETITINNREYYGVVRFDVETSGTYEITVRGEPSQSGEVLVSRPISHLFNRWPWFVAGGLGGLLVAGGIVLWIIGGVNRARAKRADAAA